MPLDIDGPFNTFFNVSSIGDLFLCDTQPCESSMAHIRLDI